MIADKEAGERRTRSDAVRNRQIILTTAERLFAERGLSASLNELAHAAGVGVGTVYRHFPDKDSIIIAMAEAQIEGIVAQTDEYLRMDDPGMALRLHLIDLLQISVENRVLSEIYESLEEVSQTYQMAAEKAKANIQELTGRARNVGAVTKEFRWEDIRILVQMTSVLAKPENGVSREKARRWIHILVDQIVLSNEAEL